MLPRTYEDQNCSIARALEVLGDRWTILVMREAFMRVRRFEDFQRNLGIARNVLADRLRRLVEDGMFERVRYRTDPDWYEYRLTERALDLYPAIVALMRWADKHMAAEDDADVLELIHRPCGEPAHPYLACSHCHEPVTAREIETRVRSQG